MVNREIFIKPNGEYMVEGDIMHRPVLAETMTRLASDPTAFYNPSSQFAQDFLADIQEIGASRSKHERYQPIMRNNYNIR